MPGAARIRALFEREQIEGLATDHATARGADDLLRGEGWVAAGRVTLEPSGDELLWAEYPVSRRAPVLTTVSLPGLWATCSCAAVRFPCRHIIALLLSDLDQPFPVTIDVRPDLTGLGKPVRSEMAHSAERQAAVVAGMADLRLWLSDLAREGLADLPRRGRAKFLGAANRLEDAYAVEAARALRETAAIPGSGTDWPERLLPGLGRLALLCESFRRLDALFPGERGDTLAAAGFLSPATGERVTDTWRILGQTVEVENRVTHLRSWLRGWATGRWARLDQAIPAGQLQGVCLPTGALVGGTLAFSPSAYPLMAQPAGPLAPVHGETGDPVAHDDIDAAHGDIDAVMSGWSAALALNPWLRCFPMVIRDVWVEPPLAAGGRWRLRDRAGHILPLPPQFGHGWSLTALSAGRPMTLFGEWDGALFVPASVLAGTWRPLSAWKVVV